ncbi:MAG: type III pantothenate kinase [Thermacetogeniaceae bacterium]|jgi:type III pantothenate kinase|nr:type III pantothenate kinase [Thermoanaerobacterales bacterium]NLN21112.1 type III pantothenate kinase [Syntrophomonadaceae bacterium]
MILVFDVGNTNIVLGVFDQDKLVTSWRIATNRRHTADDLGVLVKNLFYFRGLQMDDIEALVMSSVVPPLTPAIVEMCKRYFGRGPLVVGPGVKTGMPIRYENPREVGADRIVNAVSVASRYGVPAIIVDFGTATTFCAVSRSGEYLGGAIAPGIGISTEALFEKAAKLPRIELVKPDQVIGKNTVASMQSGIYYGYLGQLEGIVHRFKKEIGDDAVVVATGGLAPLICSETDCVDYIDPDITLWGLKIIYERNS